MNREGRRVDAAVVENTARGSTAKPIRECSTYATNHKKPAVATPSPLCRTKSPTHGDSPTDNTDEEDSDSQITPYAEVILPGGENTSTTGELQTATEQVTVSATPLPTTPISCSTSIDPRQTQPMPDQDSTPIRATATFENETAKDKEKGKSKSAGQTEKKVRFQSETNPRRSSRIRGAKRTEKLGGIEYF